MHTCTSKCIGNEMFKEKYLVVVSVNYIRTYNMSQSEKTMILYYIIHSVIKVSFAYKNFLKLISSCMSYGLSLKSSETTLLCVNKNS